MNRPSKADVLSRMPVGVVREYRFSRFLMYGSGVVMIVAGYSSQWLNLPIHAWLIPTLVPFLVFWCNSLYKCVDFNEWYALAEKDAWIDYDAKVVEEAANKIEAIAFREMVRDPAVLRQLLTAFDHVEVGIENITVKYRGKDVKLRACRLWRDGDTLRIRR